MPVDTRINIPFIPQEGITAQILNAIQLANEHHHQAIQEQQAQQQVNQQGQQITQQGQVGQATIEELKARAGFYGTEAQKSQIQIDNMKKAQALFGGNPDAQQNAPTQQAAPSAQQQAQMYPGSDLAKAVSSDPQSFAPSQQAQPVPQVQWMPSNTPKAIAPLIAPMLPKDLNDQEKNVVESGAAAGRLEAMQTGNVGAYLTGIRNSVDSVITARNKNVENQPATDADRSNFSKNILPSFENLSPAQMKGAAGELAQVKTRKELDQLEGRLMQQDNQALQREIAQKNIVANKEIAHGQALDLAGRNKVVADTQKWSEAQTQANLALKTLDAAKDGDDLATRMVSTMEVLGINMTGGIKRISPSEADAARVPVAWANHWNQWLDSKTAGATTPELVKEGKRLMNDLINSKYDSYLGEVRSTADTFNIDKKSLYIMNKNGEPAPLADTIKRTPASGAASAWDVKVPGADGKMYYGNSKTKELGPPVE